MSPSNTRATKRFVDLDSFQLFGRRSEDAVTINRGKCPNPRRGFDGLGELLTTGVVVLNRLLVEGERSPRCKTQRKHSPGNRFVIEHFTSEAEPEEMAMGVHASA